MMLYILMLCISILIINIVFYFDNLNKKKLIISITYSIGINIFILYLNISPNARISLSILLALFFTAAYTDLREKKILNINLILFNISTVGFMLYDISSNNVIKYKLTITLIATIIIYMLKLMKLIGEGDLPLIISVCYFFNLNSVVIFVFSSILTIFIGIGLYIFKKASIKYVPLAPGLLLAILIFLFYNFALNTNISVNLC